MRPIHTPFVVIVLVGLLDSMGTMGSPTNQSSGRAGRRDRDQASPPRAETSGRSPGQAPVSIAAAPAPRLDPITRFIPPIDPWVQAGLAWGDVATADDGEPLCVTNQPPRTTCDPAGPRPFLHTGFDALPATDRTVRASAAGRVVSARKSFALFIGGGPGESGGVVIVEHDLDGNPATSDDLLQTIYEHVDPLVAVGDIVSPGDIIARTSIVRGEYLHFGVRRAGFNSSDPDVYRSALPPPGTTACLPCYGRPLPMPAFPERWEDPADLLRGPSNWAEILGRDKEGGGDVLERPDGYLVGGWTRAANIGGAGGTDMWLVKLDPQGRIVSQRAYGQAGNEEIRRLLPTQDGGFVALAQSSSTVLTQNSPLILKFDASGEHIAWQTQYLAGFNFWANDLLAASDGGYVIAGTTDACCGGPPQGVIMKLDPGGAVQWARTYRVALAGPPRMEVISVAEANDGGFVLAGTVTPGPLGGDDLLVSRLDSTGLPVWTSMFGGTGSDAPGEIEATTDGGFVIVGERDLPFHLPGLWLLKIRSDGSRQTESVYSALAAEAGTRMVQTPDGGFVLAGHTHVTDHNGDLWILHLDPTGQIVKQRAFDGRGGVDDVTGLRPTRDGGFILSSGQDIACSRCGYELPPNNLVVVKTDADLEVSSGCGEDTGAQLYSNPSFVFTPVLIGETLAVASLPAGVTEVDTGAQVHACAGGSYGPPPFFQAASVGLSDRAVACDFTQLIEDLVCDLGGIPGVQATSPVILNGSYDELSIDARVTDSDSTPDTNDIVDVRAGLLQAGSSFPISVPLLDDGSTTIVPVSQFVNDFAENCFEDPVHGTCVCSPATYPTRSGDNARGDSVHSSRRELINNTESMLLTDCGMLAFHLEPLLFPPSASVAVSIQATDRLGNVSVWPEPFEVRTGVNSLACSGDACGCCLLIGLSRGQDILDCAGLPGMPSPQFPCGLCVALPAGGCVP